MNTIAENLKKLGFEKELQEAVHIEDLETFEIARVMAVHKGRYTISNGVIDVLAELVGKLTYGTSSPIDYPAVGDWVLVTFYDGKRFAIIQKVLSRKSLLKRKTPGKKVDFQLIATNIDVAFIVQSLNENFNLRRLERYLVMVNESSIQPIILLSKSDLLPVEEIANKIDEIRAIMPQLQIIPFSNEDESGLDIVKEIMQPGQTYCLLGSSGTGKTSLINKLTGGATYKTKTISKKGSKGRHATTHRQLIKLNSGAMVVDTPGMRELGNFSVDTGLDETFSEVITLSEKCRFNNCSHLREDGCAILQAVKDGSLSGDRYQNYIKLTKESAYNEMSYLDKKKKDKQLGKLYKSAMAHKKKNR